jgi:hypothetical protein
MRISCLDEVLLGSEYGLCSTEVISTLYRKLMKLVTHVLSLPLSKELY